MKNNRNKSFDRHVISKLYDIYLLLDLIENEGIVKRKNY